MNICISCDSSKVKKTYQNGQAQYECKDCGEGFSEEELFMIKGKKSKTKVKFTGRNRE